jgi:hypothetical protein
MKTIIIAATSVIFIFGIAFAREVISSPIAPLHGASIIVESRVALLNSADRENSAPCRAHYFTTTKGDGIRTTRKSVDCDE